MTDETKPDLILKEIDKIRAMNTSEECDFIEQQIQNGNLPEAPTRLLTGIFARHCGEPHDPAGREASYTNEDVNNAIADAMDSFGKTQRGSAGRISEIQETLKSMTTPGTEELARALDDPIAEREADAALAEQRASAARGSDAPPLVHLDPFK